MNARNIIFNQGGNVRTIFKLLSFILLFQIIGVLLIKIGVPLLQGNLFYLSFMVNVFSCSAVLIALHFYSKFIDKSSFAKFGMYPGKHSGSLFMNGAIVATTCLLIVILPQTSNAVISFEPNSIYNEYNLGFVYLSQAIRYLTGGIFEEVLATSFLFILVVYGFKPSSKWYLHRHWIAIISSALLFGLIHSTNESSSVVGILNLTLFGAITTTNFARTRNLAFAIGFHFLWNFNQNVLFGLPNSGKPSEAWIFKTTIQSPKLISGGDFGIEGSIVITVMLLLILVQQVVHLKNTRLK